jgi:hypothetical protein
MEGKFGQDEDAEFWDALGAVVEAACEATAYSGLDAPRRAYDAACARARKHARVLAKLARVRTDDGYAKARLAGIFESPRGKAYDEGMSPFDQGRAACRDPGPGVAVNPFAKGTHGYRQFQAGWRAGTRAAGGGKPELSE